MATSVDDSAKSTDLQIGTVIKDKWQLIQCIGEGAFGQLFLARTMPPARIVEIAVKFERNDTPKKVLHMETNALIKVQGKPHFAQAYYYGYYKDTCYLVQEALGPNLLQLVTMMKYNRFSLGTVLLLGMQAIDALETFHNAGYVHRDLKPANFLVGRTPKTFDMLYLIDFGLIKRTISSSGTPLPKRKNVGFRGTIRYASVNAHHGRDLSRVDDLWSLLFIMVEFYTGYLPWCTLDDKDEVAKLKEEMQNEKIVTQMPSEFIDFVKHLQTCEFETIPDYSFLRSCLQTCFYRLGGNDAMHLDFYQYLVWDYQQQRIKTTNQQPVKLSPSSPEEKQHNTNILAISTPNGDSVSPSSATSNDHQTHPTTSDSPPSSPKNNTSPLEEPAEPLNPTFHSSPQPGLLTFHLPNKPAPHMTGNLDMTEFRRRNAKVNIADRTLVEDPLTPMLSQRRSLNLLLPVGTDGYVSPRMSRPVLGQMNRMESGFLLNAAQVFGDAAHFGQSGQAAKSPTPRSPFTTPKRYVLTSPSQPMSPVGDKRTPRQEQPTVQETDSPRSPKRPFQSNSDSLSPIPQATSETLSSISNISQADPADKHSQKQSEDRPNSSPSTPIHSQQMHIDPTETDPHQQPPTSQPFSAKLAFASPNPRPSSQSYPLSTPPQPTTPPQDHESEPIAFTDQEQPSQESVRDPPVSKPVPQQSGKERVHPLERKSFCGCTLF
ncbi:putative Tau-tubulin kinase 1 [Blattamonas nauphoetae]|uniref:non-specific serine/threonine protein kinase n=1 Tax=Blattamonas nauphoetae TaxID=2049346 RepID=A0ABQ9YHQ7_9EUKA|nr:putative Tau-tubulin kinase 1 [Blattamonas nauphoetae]